MNRCKRFHDREPIIKCHQFSQIDYGIEELVDFNCIIGTKCTNNCNKVQSPNPTLQAEFRRHH
jgi:hypothetical protein